MRVLQVLSYPNTGGASKACLRLHESLIGQGVHSDILMLSDWNGSKNSHNYYTHHESRLSSKSLLNRIIGKSLYLLGFSMEKKVKRIRKNNQRIGESNDKNKEVISFSVSNYDITTHPIYQKADLVHLHWISGGFINYEVFFKKNRKPVIWTLHDMNPFTGGCHFSAGCLAFRNGCQDCHFFDDHFSKLLISDEFKRKYNSLKSCDNLHIVSPSRFLYNYSSSSKIFGRFPHSHIPYGVDSEIFKPHDQIKIREKLGLPSKEKVILFVAAHNIYHRRKGLDLLFKAIHDLKEQPRLCTVGPIPKNSNNALDITHFGEIFEESKLAEIYSACDIFVAPSIEDNLPNTVLESLMTGTPVVAFEIGGMSDMVEDGVNGCLVKQVNSKCLREGLERSLNISFDRTAVAFKSRKKYTLEKQAGDYVKIYEQALVNYKK